MLPFYKTFPFMDYYKNEDAFAKDLGMIKDMVIEICHTEFEFDNFNEVMDYFKKMINICKQMNYSKFKSEEYDKFHKQLQELVEERKA